MRRVAGEVGVILRSPLNMLTLLSASANVRQDRKQKIYLSLSLGKYHWHYILHWNTTTPSLSFTLLYFLRIILACKCNAVFNPRLMYPNVTQCIICSKVFSLWAHCKPQAQQFLDTRFRNSLLIVWIFKKSSTTSHEAQKPINMLCEQTGSR